MHGFKAIATCRAATSEDLVARLMNAGSGGAEEGACAAEVRGDRRGMIHDVLILRNQFSNVIISISFLRGKPVWMVLILCILPTP
jgi:hypothetical protein